MYSDRMSASLALVRKNVPNGGRILEVGSGAGQLSEKLTLDGYDVISSDLAVRMASSTRERVGGDQCIVADVQSLPFREGMFDAVVLIGVISYVDDAAEVLRKLRSLLNENGVLVISSANTNLLLSSIGRKLSEPFYWVGFDRPKIKKSKSFLANTCTYYKAAEFNSLVCESGYQLLESRNVGFGRFKLMQKNVFSAFVDITLARIVSFISRANMFGRLGQYAFANIACFRPQR